LVMPTRSRQKIHDFPLTIHDLTRSPRTKLAIFDGPHRLAHAGILHAPSNLRLNLPMQDAPARFRRQPLRRSNDLDFSVLPATPSRKETNETTRQATFTIMTCQRADAIPLPIGSASFRRPGETHWIGLTRPKTGPSIAVE